MNKIQESIEKGKSIDEISCFDVRIFYIQKELIQAIIEEIETELKNNMETQDEPIEAEGYRQGLKYVTTLLKESIDI